mgnify:CR=1 FL=1
MRARLSGYDPVTVGIHVIIPFSLSTIPSGSFSIVNKKSSLSGSSISIIYSKSSLTSIL